MKKRKGIAVLLILILSLAVTACGNRYGVKEGESYIYCMEYRQDRTCKGCG